MKHAPFTADRLLALYDRVAEAEDAIPRLRRFVLDLAVRGKLLEQDPTDEPAAELLKRIAKEKARLAKAKAIRSPKPQEPIEAIELPCALPRSNWAWARLNDIGRLSGGMTPSMNRADYWGGEVIWLSPKDIKSDEVSTSELKITELGLAETRLEAYPVGCLFIVARSGILKRTLPVAINRQPAASNQDLKVLVPYLNGMERYLQIMLSGFEAFILSDLVKTGTTVQSLKYDEFACQPFPLPPLAEQQRIVAKVDDLMALCDRLQAARAGREAVRDRLTAATLARLTAPEPDAETFPAHARAALQTLPALTTRPDQIKTLRQTILNLAVRGKLVEQDPTDEPAADLLKRIGAAHPKRKNLKKHEFAVPNKLADGWSVVHLDAIASFENGDRSSNYPSGSDIKSEGVPFFSTKNLTDHRLHFSNLDFITDEKFASLRSGKLADQDILITLRGSVGKFGLFEATPSISTGFINAQLMIIRSVDHALVPYLLRFMQSGIFSEQVTRLSSGSATPQLSAGKLGEAELWLPPLAEQHRIVAKVDALMALCDQLESSLTTATTTRSRLLEALLHEALEPAIDLAEAAQ